MHQRKSGCTADSRVCRRAKPEGENEALHLLRGDTELLEMLRAPEAFWGLTPQAQSRSAALQNMSGAPTGAQVRSGHRSMSS